MRIWQNPFVQVVTYMVIVVVIMVALGGVTGYCDAGIKIIEGMWNLLSTNSGAVLWIYSVIFLLFFMVACAMIMIFDKIWIKILFAFLAVLSLNIQLEAASKEADIALGYSYSGEVDFLVRLLKMGCSMF